MRMVEVPDNPAVTEWQQMLKEKKPDLLVAIRMPLTPAAGARIAELTVQGAEVIHLVADEFGMEEADEPFFIKDRMKEVHLSLVDKGLRDQITIIAGGGIAMAEHMAKVIICGADAVSCDIPLLVAMECRVCRRCAQGIACPVELEEVDPGVGQPPHQEPDGRLAQPAPGDHGRHGYARGQTASRRDGTRHVLRGPGAGIRKPGERRG